MTAIVQALSSLTGYDFILLMSSFSSGFSSSDMSGFRPAFIPSTSFRLCVNFSWTFKFLLFNLSCFKTNHYSKTNIIASSTKTNAYLNFLLFFLFSKHENICIGWHFKRILVAENIFLFMNGYLLKKFKLRNR